MGINFDKILNRFEFTFDHDDVSDIISITGGGYQVEAFGKCFYYGYEFSDDVDGNIRSQFIKYLKFSSPIQEHPELVQFVQKAINDLNSKINLYDYDLVIMPQSSSLLNQYMLKYIYRFAQPTLRSMELVKNMTQNINFDVDAYRRQYLQDVLDNGRPRYTEKQKSDVLRNIEEMMELIHQKEYFTIAKDVKKNKMRPYIMNFLRFASEEEKAICEAIHRNNILVVDDITTSGSTLNEILRTLRIINEDNSITLFSLIGRKDLMIEG